MNKQTLKTKLKQQAKQIAWRAITTVILTLTAVITFWVYAAFVEPSVSPTSSDQDFAQNILGANDANNDFDSSAVVANKDGSIIERAEYVFNRMTTQGQWYSLECTDSTTTATSTCYIDDTAKYVGANACSAASNTGYCYMNTATFSAMDADLVAGNIMSGTTIFGVAGTANSTCYYGSTAQVTNWNAGLYGCTGSDKRCYGSSCVTCGGWMQEGYCWYQGAANQNCNTVCSTHGGVYNDTCNWPGGAANCWACTHYGGTGSCEVSTEGPFQYDWGITHRCYYGTYTAPSCTGSSDAYKMICACNQ